MMTDKAGNTSPAPSEDVDDAVQTSRVTPCEVGGRKGPEPTRYGDWEKNGIASDF